MRAVILAAGMGTRFGGNTSKLLVKIDNRRTLIGNQIEILTKMLGRDKILLVLGHKPTGIMEAHPDLMYVYNPRYAHTNTAKSLLCALGKLSGDVLWTNADVYFDEVIAKRLIESSQKTSRALVNRAVTADEEVKYTLDEDGMIHELSKSVIDAAGESLGMQIVVDRDVPTLREALEAVEDSDYFEKALEVCTLGGRIKLAPVDVGDAFCHEVDYPEDLERVRKYLAEQS